MIESCDNLANETVIRSDCEPVCLGMSPLHSARKRLILLDLFLSPQVPKVLVPAAGGHGIAFITVSFHPVRSELCLLWAGNWNSQSELAGSQLRHEKNTSRVEAEAAVEVRTCV